MKKIIALLMIGTAIFLLAMNRKPDSFLVTALVSEDQNPKNGEGAYKLHLGWELANIPNYKCISLEINDESFVLDPLAANFETWLYEPSTEYKIVLRAHKKRLGLPLVKNIRLNTGADNEEIPQVIIPISLTDKELVFKHEIPLEGASYEVRPLFQEEGMRIEPEKEDGYYLVTVPLTPFEGDIALNITVQGDNFFTTLKTAGEPLTVGGPNHRLEVDQNGFVLFNTRTKAHPLEKIQFFGESLHPQIDGLPEFYSLKAPNGEGVSSKYEPANNGAVRLGDIAPGQYYLFLDGLPVLGDGLDPLTWYTVARKGHPHEVQVKNLNGLLALEVVQVEGLPEGLYDILIDPGHGGMDTGTFANGLFESEEVLNLSHYMARRFEDHGLKVKLSREGDYEPAQCQSYNYLESPYYDGGRIEQVYCHQPKYMISNHLNAVGTGALISGFEIYTSVFTDNGWSQAVSESLSATGRVARDSLLNEYRVSKGSFKKWSPSKDCPHNIHDYLYILRESGGTLSWGTALTKNNPDTYPTMPDYGAETMLIEYAYVDNPEEAELWRKHYKEWGELVVKGTLEYLGIFYKEK